MFICQPTLLRNWKKLTLPLTFVVAVSIAATIKSYNITITVRQSLTTRLAREQLEAMILPFIDQFGIVLEIKL